MSVWQWETSEGSYYYTHSEVELCWDRKGQKSKQTDIAANGLSDLLKMNKWLWIDGEVAFCQIANNTTIDNTVQAWSLSSVFEGKMFSVSLNTRLIWWLIGSMRNNNASKGIEKTVPTTENNKTLHWFLFSTNHRVSLQLYSCDLCNVHTD